MERIAMGWLVVLVTLSGFNVLWSAVGQRQVAADTRETQAWAQQSNRPVKPPQPRVTIEAIVAQASASVATALFIWGVLSAFAAPRAVRVSAALTWLLVGVPMAFIFMRVAGGAAGLGYLIILAAAGMVGYEIGRYAGPPLRNRIQPADSADPGATA